MLTVLLSVYEAAHKGNGWDADGFTRVDVYLLGMWRFLFDLCYSTQATRSVGDSGRLRNHLPHRLQFQVGQRQRRDGRRKTYTVGPFFYRHSVDRPCEYHITRLPHHLDRATF